MHLLAHILFHFLAGQARASKEFDKALKLDLRDVGDLDAACAHVLAGGRYALLTRRIGPDEMQVESSPVVVVPSGGALPDGWSGGRDVTAEVLRRLGLPARDMAVVGRVGKRLSFRRGLDRPSRYTRGSVVVAMLCMAGWSALCAGWASWANWGDGTDASLVGSLMLTLVVVGLVGVFPIGLPFAYAMAASGATDHGGPLHRRAYAAILLWALATLPMAVIALSRSLAVATARSQWFEAVGATDLVGPSRLEGFAVPTASSLALERPQDLPWSRSWALYENRHPAGVPRYSEGEHGLIASWEPETIAVDRASYELPGQLRASSPDDVAWIAYVARPRLAEAIAWDNGKSSDIECVNVRVIDVRTSQIVAVAAGCGAPNAERAEHPERVYYIAPSVLVVIVASAVGDSYARPP